MKDSPFKATLVIHQVDIDQENEMNPYVEKFLATTRIYLQIFTGLTQAENAKNKEPTV